MTVLMMELVVLLEVWASLRDLVAILQPFQIVKISMEMALQYLEKNAMMVTKKIMMDAKKEKSKLVMTVITKQDQPNAHALTTMNLSMECVKILTVVCEKETHVIQECTFHG